MTAAAQSGQALADAVTPSSSPSSRGVGGMVLAGAAQVAATLTDGGGPVDRGEWLSVVGTCQSLINTLTAVQDTALAQSARRESDWCEDGTLAETVHAPGRVALDAADLAAPLLGASHAQAQRRVELAVRLAADRVPVPAELRDLPEASGLHGLHAAMAQGRVDGYRAGVVAFELEIAPADVAEAVVTALDPHLGDDASKLRQRTRVLLSRISPDLVREHAKRARAATGLRRWVGEPGVDEWHGTFPSEDAASAWAAIDKLAHELVADGTCSNIEQARGKALTDLVTGHATVDVNIVLTVPADSVPSSAGASRGDEAAGTVPTGDTDRAQTVLPGEASVVDPTSSATALSGGSDDALMQVQGARPSDPLLVRLGWLRDHLTKKPPPPRRGRPTVTPVFVPCDPLTGARLDPHDHLAADAYHPSAELVALVKARDGRCRFPGCAIAARFCDLDHVRPWPTGRTAASNLLTLCRRHHRIKQRPGWRLRLAADGTTTWTDPTGRVRTTAPLDALQSLVLEPTEPTEPNEPAPSTLTADTTAGNDTTTSSWSALETNLELRLEHRQAVGHDWFGGSAHRRCTSTADLRAGVARRRAHPSYADQPPF